MATKKKTVKELSNLIPSKIESHGHHGNLTIMKRSNDKYFCYYPFHDKKIIPTSKGKSIEVVMNKMYNELVNRDILPKEEKVRAKKKKKSKSKRKPLTSWQKRIIKIAAQKRSLKNK